MKRYDPVIVLSEYEGIEETPRGAYVRAEDVQALLAHLRRGACWCGVGVGNRAMQGKHSEACIEIQEFMKDWTIYPIRRDDVR